MDRINEILEFVRDKNDFVSGEFISRELKISRTAIWKYMNQIEQKGYVVDKLKGKGYRLISSPDKIYPWEIKRHLKTEKFGHKIIYFDSVDSTNSVAFKMALEGKPEGTCVVAEGQSHGKGRLNRVWHSPPGKNICISIILKPAVHPTQVYPLTFISSLAVQETIETMTERKATLKWPNDVMMGGKKVSGTLIELSMEADLVRFVVIGLGLNINMKLQDLDRDIEDKATSLAMETNKSHDRSAVGASFLNCLERYYALFMEKGSQEVCSLWEKRAGIKGTYLEVNQMGESFKGISDGIDATGAMLLNINGSVKRIIAGDVIF